LRENERNRRGLLEGDDKLGLEKFFDEKDIDWDPLLHSFPFAREQAHALSELKFLQEVLVRDPELSVVSKSVIQPFH
jgi:hypothetical protein